MSPSAGTADRRPNRPNTRGAHPAGRRRLRWWLLGGIVLACIVAASAAVPFLVPVDRYRAVLEHAIRTSTGRDVRIGALRLEVWPALHVRARDVRLMNPPGFPSGATVEAKTVNLGVDLHALLNRRLSIKWISVAGVRVNILTSTTGRSNFDAPARPAAPPVPARTSAPSRSSVPSRASAPSRAPASSRASAAQPLLTLSPIGLVSIKKIDVAAGTYDPRRRSVTPTFALAGLNARTRSVDVTAPDWLRRLEVTVDLKGARLTLPSLRAPIDARAGRLVIANGGATAVFTIVVDKMQATGTAAVARLDAPTVSYSLAVPRLDVNRLQGLLRAQPGPGAPARSGASGASGPGGPRRLIANGTVNVNQLAFAPLAITGLRAHLGVYTDVIRVSAYSLSAYGGTATGSASLNPAAAGAPITAIVHARKVDLAALVRAVAPGAQQLSGALDADMDLRTLMAADPRAALAGTGTFAIHNGSFPGLDVRSGLAKVARLLQAGVPTGETRFSYFGGDARIARGRVYSDALRLDGDSLQATGHGSAGFDGSLDYAGTGVLAQVVSSQSASAGPLPSMTGLLGGYTQGAAGRPARIPFKLTGVLPNPHFALGGMPQLMDRPGTPPAPPHTAPSSPQIPDLPGFLQNLPQLP